jgi:hypothetical protein
MIDLSRRIMSFSEAAVAIGLLTPLILGILAFIEKFINRKKVEPPRKDEPEVSKGMPVGLDFASEYIEEIKADRAKAEKERDFYKAQIEAYKQMDKG